jgi:thioredoxin 1
MGIASISDATFQKNVIESGVPVLVDFWAPWCGPCRAISSELEKLNEEYGEKLTIYKLNIDENPLTPRSLYIRSIPTLLFYPGRNEAPVSVVGATTAKDLARRFRLKEVLG